MEWPGLQRVLRGPQRELGGPPMEGLRGSWAGILSKGMMSCRKHRGGPSGARGRGYSDVHDRWTYKLRAAQTKILHVFYKTSCLLNLLPKRREKYDIIICICM